MIKGVIPANHKGEANRSLPGACATAVGGLRGLSEHLAGEANAAAYCDAHFPELVHHASAVRARQAHGHQAADTAADVYVC